MAESEDKFIEDLNKYDAISSNEIQNYWEKWMYSEDQSASTDSRVGWSTAFFSLLISALLAVVMEYGGLSPWVKYIGITLIVSTLIGTGFLVAALFPVEQNRIIREEYPHEVIKYLRRYAEWTDISSKLKEKNTAKFNLLVKEFVFARSLLVQNGKVDYWKQPSDIRNIINSNGEIPFIGVNVGASSSDWLPSVNDYFNHVHGVALKMSLESKDIALEILQCHNTQNINLLRAAYSFAIPIIWFLSPRSLLIIGRQWKKNNANKVFITKGKNKKLKIYTDTSIAHFDALVDFLRERM